MSDNNGREWQILEKAVMASVDEQRKARRWSIVFKVLTFAYILAIIISVFITVAKQQTLPAC